MTRGAGAITCIEPLCIEEDLPVTLGDAVLNLVRASDGLGAGLCKETLAEVATIVRVADGVYSDRIEGINAVPHDFEGTRPGAFVENPKARSRQHLSAAHVRLRSEIDRLAASGELGDPWHPDFARWLHGELYRERDAQPRSGSEADDDGPPRVERQPGEWRNADVEGFGPLPPPHDQIAILLSEFHRRMQPHAEQGQANRVLAMATTYHRWNVLQPFRSGNGPVSRLMSHAMAYHAGIAAQGLWSISRGLSRRGNEYGAMMRFGGQPRRGDRDGQGDLSLAALKTFAEWFLTVCLDEVTRMQGYLEPSGLRSRLLRYAAARDFRAGGPELLRAVLIKGRVERGDVGTILGLSPRTARGVIKELSDDGILGSVTPGSALELRFPSDTHAWLFPGILDG